MTKEKVYVRGVNENSLEPLKKAGIDCFLVSNKAPIEYPDRTAANAAWSRADVFIFVIGERLTPESLLTLFDAYETILSGKQVFVGVELQGNDPCTEVVWQELRFLASRFCGISLHVSAEEAIRRTLEALRDD